MKRINRPTRNSSFPCYRPHLDEIEDAVAIMKSHGWNATITDKSFEYDGLADLKERNGRRIRSVSVVGRPSDSEDTYGQVEVAFEDGRVRLDRSFTTVPSDSLWLALVGRFTRREPHFLFTFLPPLVVLLALVRSLNSVADPL